MIIVSLATCRQLIASIFVCLNSLPIAIKFCINQMYKLVGVYYIPRWTLMSTTYTASEVAYLIVYVTLVLK